MVFMKLIEDLGTERQKNGKWLHFGYFFCKYCKKQSKKILSSGLKAKGCGCFESKITRNNYKHGETNTKIYAVWCTENNRNKRNKRNNKYTLEIIKEIRALWNTGNYTQKELAEKYNTTNKYIYKIINNKIWKN